MHIGKREREGESLNWSGRGRGSQTLKTLDQLCKWWVARRGSGNLEDRRKRTDAKTEV